MFSTIGLDQYTHECVQILEHVEQYRCITVREAEAFIIIIARPTIKNRFAQLVELGFLERKGSGISYSKTQATHQRKQYKLYLLL